MKAKDDLAGNVLAPICGTTAPESRSGIEFPSPEQKKLIKKAMFIRRFEEKLLNLFSKGELQGTVHTCIGEEWTGVAAAEALKDGDTIFSNHRCHGHYLARTGDAFGLLAEIMGKKDGSCGGIGGSQHLYARGFFSNGIQGGMLPVSSGTALANKLQGFGSLCLTFIGDGTLGQGIVYETFNLASKWKLPLLIVVENNRIAQSTPQAQFLSGSIEDRAKAFDIKFMRTSTNDWNELIKDLKYAANHVREKCIPFIIEVVTFRLKAHSKGDDTREQTVIAHYEELDPLNVFIENYPDESSKMIKNIDNNLNRALAKARKSANPLSPAVKKPQDEPLSWRKIKFKSDRGAVLVYESLKAAMEKDERLILMGEDIEAPYGGAFKITRDLSGLFPGRVRNTPISEGALVGAAAGLALAGYRPVVEIMFGDFLTLAFDQLYNHACKFSFMYDGKVEVPMIVRTPMGGHRGYGPTHSQTLEKHFLGIPNLDILALNIRVSPEMIYENLFASLNNPTLVIENKVLYTKFLRTGSMAGYEISYSSGAFPVVKISPNGRIPDLTIFCYGGTLEMVEDAVEIVFDDHDIICEVISPVRIQPLDDRPVVDSVRASGRLLSVEEGPSIAGLGGELAAGLAEKNSKLKRFKRLGCNSFIPCSRELEKTVIPGTETIVKAILEAVNA